MNDNATLGDYLVELDGRPNLGALAVVSTPLDAKYFAYSSSEHRVFSWFYALLDIDDESALNYC